MNYCIIIGDRRGLKLISFTEQEGQQGINLIAFQIHFRMEYEFEKRKLGISIQYWLIPRTRITHLFKLVSQNINGFFFSL